MMTYVLCAIYFASTLCALITGRAAEAGQAFLEGGQAAVSFILGIAGAVCLWSGLCELMERCGVSSLLSRILGPLLRRLFPQSAGERETMAALSENLSANILGLGNAATPAGIRAAKAMARQGRRDELCMLVVLNSASLQLIPSTIAAARQAAGAASAFDIMPAVWFSSAVSLAVALGAAALFRRLWP